MTLKNTIRLAGGALLVALAAAGCSREAGPLRPWPLSTDPVVFRDAFDGSVVFQAFGNSQLDALSTDTSEQYAGTGCLRITVPNAGGYAGGAFTTTRARNLSGYSALVLYAKASRAVTLDVVGLGNDNTGTSKLEARRTRVPVTTSWSRIVIPIPSPARLAVERGLFFFAAAPQGGSGYVVWFDEIAFEQVPITDPRPAITPQSLNAFVGSTATVTGTRDTFTVNGTERVVVEHMPGYFSYASSDPAVATVGEGGAIRVVGTGTAVVTARLDTTLAAGAVTVNALSFTPGPAPTPTLPAADVISLFSDSYANRPVDKWSADWDRADVADLDISGAHYKVYTNLYYAGIEFTTNTVDASAMTAFHADVWLPSGATFNVKLVDFGANGVYNGPGSDDSEQELAFNATTTPAIVAGSWVGIEIPLAAFTNLQARGHLAQLILSSADARTAYVDNLYFHR